MCRAWRIAPFNGLFKVYVEAIRNTPFLIQLMFVFFGLPSLGLQINEWQAALLTTVVNLGPTSPRSCARASRKHRVASWKLPARWP